MIPEKARIVSSLAVIFFVASSISLSISSAPSLADTPWADEYGFNYPDGVNTEFYVTWSGMLHSGIETYWDSTPGSWTDPSTHKSLCNTGWPASYYFNKDIGLPYDYLSGNAMFVFFGHGSKTWLKYYNGGLSNPYYRTSYIRDVRRAGDTKWSIYISDDYYQIGDMAFAALFGCRTAQGEDGMAYYWRCVKGVDTVVGFDSDIGNLCAHNFNENFFWWTGHNYTVSQARSLALADVQTELINNGWPDFGGVDTCEIWGSTSQKIMNPHFGSNSY